MKNTKEEARSLASETITDLTKQIILMGTTGLRAFITRYPESMRLIGLFSMQL